MQPRREGSYHDFGPQDQSNAEYWYRRVRVAPSVLTLDAEWEELVRRFLA